MKHNCAQQSQLTELKIDYGALLYSSLGYDARDTLLLQTGQFSSALSLKLFLTCDKRVDCHRPSIQRGCHVVCGQSPQKLVNLVWILHARMRSDL